MHKAGAKKWGTDESVFTNVMGTQSMAQMQQTFKDYRELAGADVEKAIQKELSGDLQASLMTIVQCARDRCQHFAVRLYQSMKVCLASFLKKYNPSQEWQSNVFKKMRIFQHFQFFLRSFLKIYCVHA